MSRSLVSRFALLGVVGVLIICTIIFAGCKPEPPKIATAPTTLAASPTPKPTFTEQPTTTPTLKPTITPSPTALVSPLTGLPVSDIKLIQRRVIAARIGNDPEIRPQEGLGIADLVYEEVMEGWWDTRFTALYLESEATRIRPLRSARLSSIQIATQYDAALVNTGASDQVRWLLSQTKIVNLDEYFNSEPYHILAGYDYRGRFYTSTEEVRKYMQSKGLETTVIMKSYVFDPVPPKGTPAQQIHIPYPKVCVVDWTYDITRGVYLRFVEDEPHLEGLTGEQISASTIVILYAEHRATDIVEDSTGATSIDIILTGTGRAQVIRDGVVVEGTWWRKADNEPILYYDKYGKVIPFKPGKTWIELVPLDYDVVIK